MKLLPTFPNSPSGTRKGIEMQKIKRPNLPKFILSQEALDTHLNFLKEKDPSIIGKTCQMLSALKIITLPDREAFHFVIGVIEALKKEKGKLNWLSEEQWSDFRIDTLDKYLPKILKKREWIFSIKKYITEKILNSITIEARKRRRNRSLFIEGEDIDGKLKTIEVPALEGKFLLDDIEGHININRIFDNAKLTQREWKIFVLKETTPYTEELISEILRVSRDIVKHDYKRAKGKLDKLVKAVSR